MNCRSLILEISSYLDGDLDVVTVAEIEAHIGNCKDCRLIVDTTRKTIELYCKSEPLPLPEDIRLRLHQAVFQRIGRKPLA